MLGLCVDAEIHNQRKTFASQILLYTRIAKPLFQHGSLAFFPLKRARVWWVKHILTGSKSSGFCPSALLSRSGAMAMRQELLLVNGQISLLSAFLRGHWLEVLDVS